MSIFKEKLAAYQNRLSRFFSRCKKGFITRWRSLTPGFRYAIVYFLCVVCIASVIWWQFNPGDSLVFDPNANVNPDVPDDSDIAAPNTPDNGNEIPDVVVFSPQRGDKLLMPLQGEILAFFGQPFAMLPGMTTGGIDGIHIDGTAGDEVCAAWQGVVSSVITPDSYSPGVVWVKHGDWTTVYKNLEEICVSPGQSVEAGQRLGELSAKIFGSYTGDYLEFQLWGPDEEVYDPWEYAGVGR